MGPVELCYVLEHAGVEVDGPGDLEFGFGAMSVTDLGIWLDRCRNVDIVKEMCS